MPPGESNMADQKTEQELAAEKEAADKAAADKATAEGGDDKAGLRAALAKQAADYQKQIADLSKKVNAVEAKDLAAKEADMLAKNEHEKIIAERDKTIAEMRENSAAASRALLESSAREKLRDLGMERALSLAGAVAGLPADATTETLDAWAAQMKVNNEGEFTATVTPVGQSSVGDPHVGSLSASVAQLKADLKDPAKAADAMKTLSEIAESGKSIE